MNIGIFSFETGYSLDPAILAKRAEELGFESFWVPEHPVIPVTTTSPFLGFRANSADIPDSYAQIVDPFVALARASAVTQRIKLGTAICLVPERNPLILAKQIATLDHFSGGRFIFGIGAGWLKEETEIMGGDFPRRWTQTRDSILSMKQLWTQEEAEYHGTHYDFPPVRSFPKPVQKPHPPIFLGGKHRNVFKWVVEYGNGWMPTTRVPLDEVKRGRATLDDLAEKAGRDPSSIEVMSMGPSDQFEGHETIEAWKEVGASRVIIALRNTQGDGALAEMEDIARRVL